MLGETSTTCWQSAQTPELQAAPSTDMDANQRLPRSFAKGQGARHGLRKVVCCRGVHMELMLERFAA